MISYLRFVHLFFGFYVYSVYELFVKKSLPVSKHEEKKNFLKIFNSLESEIRFLGKSEFTLINENFHIIR